MNNVKEVLKNWTNNILSDGSDYDEERVFNTLPFYDAAGCSFRLWKVNNTKIK